MILEQSIDHVNRLLLERGNDSRDRGTKPSPAPKPAAKPAQEQPLPAAPIKRAPIVILCSGGRYIDVYSSDRLDVQWLNVPESTDGILAEQHAEAILPKRHRDQLFPGFIRGRFEAERLSPTEVAQRVAKSEVIQRLRAEGLVYTGAELQRIVCGGLQ